MPHDALFAPDGDRFVPTELTQGPWAIGAQHGGPPAALLARAMENHEPRSDLRVARFTVELLRPVPLASLSVEAFTIRPGKRVRLLGASLSSEGNQLATATAWQIQTSEAIPPTHDSSPPTGPEEGRTPTVSSAWPTGYHETGVEMRFVEGDMSAVGSSTVWIRLRQPVVLGEAPTPLQRVAAVADFGNGVSTALDPERFTFINPDLSVYLHRMPGGEWICLDAKTDAGPDGIGLAQSNLYDTTGGIGRSLQSLLLAER